MHEDEDASLIDGGSTEPQKPFEHQHVETREAEHRSNITKWLIWLLTLIVTGYPTLLTILVWNGKETKELASVFNAVLPVVAGLVGATVAYYFSRNEPRRP